MRDRALITRSYHIKAENGNFLSVEETTEGTECVLSIYDPADHKGSSCRLTMHQFQALCNLIYEIDFKETQEAPNGQPTLTEQAA